MSGCFPNAIGGISESCPSGNPHVVYSPAAQWGLDGGWSHSKSAGFCADAGFDVAGAKNQARTGIPPRLGFLSTADPVCDLLPDPTGFCYTWFSGLFHGVLRVGGYGGRTKRQFGKRNGCFGHSCGSNLSAIFLQFFGISTLAVSIVDQSSFANGKNG